MLANVSIWFTDEHLDQKEWTLPDMGENKVEFKKTFFGGSSVVFSPIP